MLDGIQMMDLDLEAQRLEKAIEERPTLIRKSDYWRTCGKIFHQLIPQELDDQLGDIHLEEARPQVS